MPLKRRASRMHTWYGIHRYLRRRHFDWRMERCEGKLGDRRRRVASNNDTEVPAPYLSAVDVVSWRPFSIRYSDEMRMLGKFHPIPPQNL